jgi:hypothetical protein
MLSKKTCKEYIADLSAWGLKNNAENFLKNASEFEFKITTEVNPFYPLLAFNVSLEACEYLLHQLDIKNCDFYYAYALIYDNLRVNEKLSLNDCVALLKSKNIRQKNFNFSSLHAKFLVGHPLEFVDVSNISIKLLKQHVPKNSNLVALRRERRFLECQLFYEDGFFCMKNQSKLLILLVTNLLSENTNVVDCDVL